MLDLDKITQGMDRVLTYYLLVTLLLLALYQKAESQWVARRPMPPINLNLPPLCTSQLALANRACAVLPYTPVPPPSPPAPPSPPSPNAPPSDDGTEVRHHHRHGHHGHDQRESRAEEECCRWVKEVDDVCVCGLLVHLSPFLTRPAHNYTVVVDESCAITFACASRLVPA